MNGANVNLTLKEYNCSFLRMKPVKLLLLLFAFLSHVNISGKRTVKSTSFVEYIPGLKQNFFFLFGLCFLVNKIIVLFKGFIFLLATLVTEKYANLKTKTVMSNRKQHMH